MDAELERMLLQFKWTTQVIARSYKEQLSLFADFSNVAAELALDWDYSLEKLHEGNYINSLTNEQKKSIEKLHTYMVSIGGEENAKYWNNEALCTSSQWERMRQMADDILETMGWEKKLPEPEKVTVVYIDNATRLRVHFEKALKKIKKIFS